MRRPVRIGDTSIIALADGIAMGEEIADVLVELWSEAFSACMSGVNPIAPVEESLEIYIKTSKSKPERMNKKKESMLGCKATNERLT